MEPSKVIAVSNFTLIVVIVILVFLLLGNYREIDEQEKQIKTQSSIIRRYEEQKRGRYP